MGPIGFLLGPLMSVVISLCLDRTDGADERLGSCQADGLATDTREYRLHLKLLGVYELRRVLDILAREVRFTR